MKFFVLKSMEKKKLFLIYTSSVSSDFMAVLKKMENEEVHIADEHQKDTEMSPLQESSAKIRIAPTPCNGMCTFSKQLNDPKESENRKKSATKLCGLIVAISLVMVIEVIGGVKANSLAVITDAAHLLTDVAGFCISLFAVWASGWEATPYQSFGFYRLEVLGALLSLQLVWLISGVLIYEATLRILYKSVPVKGVLMFATASFGFIVNLIMVIWLGHDHSHHSHDHSHHTCNDHHHHNHHHIIHDHEEKDLHTTPEDEEVPLSGPPAKTKMLNINLQGAYLHVMADLIQAVGVMIAGAFIWAKPDWLVVDLICTLIFSALVVCSTLPMLTDVWTVLMERTPQEIDMAELETGLKRIEGVRDIHDLHVWSITLGKPVLSCHVVTEDGASSGEIVNSITDYCGLKHSISHVTIQIEQ